MNKKIISILIFIILFSAFGTIVKGDNNSIEILDQEQSMKNGDNIIFCSHMAQSFKPSLNILTKVELYLNRQKEASDFITIGVRELLTGANLTTITISTSEIPLGSNYTWIQFDFQDINVIPGKTYYIIFFGSEDLENPTYCNWSWYANNDVYFNGEIWLYSLNDKTWHGSCRIGDLTFKTYGLDELPEKPIIEGRVDGFPNRWYEFRFSSIDPDGDIVTIFVDWGDGQNESTQGVSGEIKFLYHAWNTSGDYTIRAQATDEHGVKSEWAISPIHMLKSKLINTPLFLQRFFQRFPFYEKILN